MSIRNYLKLKFDRDNDGTGELLAEVYSDGFAGKGSAWFDIHRLIEFAEKLKAYPILKESPPEIAGGYLENSGLKQTHLSIKAYPIGVKGNIGIRIRISTPLNEYERPESQHSVEVELQTLYQELGLFADRFKDLIKGTVKEAVLESAA